MVDLVLNEDWSEYDNRKMRAGRNGAEFSFEEEWELHFLEEKIGRRFLSTPDAEIRAAISSCREAGVPPGRVEFISSVVNRLNRY